MKYNRGGKTLRVGDIGRMAVLRQMILLPGERLVRPTIRGNVRLSGLRQQTSVYLDARIDAFVAPLRWYYSDFPDYLKEGISTAKTIPVLTGAPWNANRSVTDQLGIGNIQSDPMKWYAQHPINVWNEHYRWPEASKISVDTPPITFFEDQGQKVVNLQSAATRIHDVPVMDTTEVNVASATTFDVRDLAAIQGRFHQAAETDWTSQERYLAFMKDVYSAQGSSEVDKIPTRMRGGAKLSVTPRDMYATDGSSLGEIMSISNFAIDNTWSDYTAKEHEIIVWIMTLRFAPILANGISPMAYGAEVPYQVMQGDAVVIAGQKPVAVGQREVGLGDGTTLGYLPFAWQHREGYSHVDSVIDSLENFPLLHGITLTADGYRDASQVHGAFRSLMLRHWFCDLDFDLNVQSQIPSAGMSIMAGSKKQGGPTGNHPTGGWLY